MHARWQGSCLWPVLFVALCGVGHAQSVSPEDEYKKLIKVSQDIQPLGAHPFGENISLYDGTLSFDVTDISVRGNGPTLTVGRKLATWQSSAYKIGARPFGDWDLEIPHLETLVSNEFGWQVGIPGTQTGTTQRCTNFGPPPYAASVGGGGTWAPEAWWYGYHLLIPDEGDQTLLPRTTGNTLSPTMSGASFPIVTKHNWMIRCGVTASDGGEGFFAVAPDGTRYTFAHLVYRQEPEIQEASGTIFPATTTAQTTTSPQPTGSAQSGLQPMLAPVGSDNLLREDALMYVTEVQDRFGNTLTYNYSGDNLTSIVASDGREVDLSYVSGTPQIATITVKAANAPSRTWTYSYGTASAGNLTLTGVQLPDGSAWSYNMGSMSAAQLTTTGGDCSSNQLPTLISGGVSGSVTQPSGLTATFTLAPMLHGRSYVPEKCYGTASTDLPLYFYPEYDYQFSLTSEVVSGAGMPTETWSYRYSTANQSTTSDPCAASGTCATTVYTDVTDPGGNDTRYNFSNRYDASEGQLLRTDYFSGAVGGTLLRSVSNLYANPTGGPWPTAYGVDLQGRDNQAQSTEASPLQQRTTTQGGDTYTWQAESFNSYAQVTQQKRYSSIAGEPTLEESLGYLNDTNLWVLGLPTTVTNVATGEVESQNVYDTTKDTLSQRWRFGQQLMSYTFDSAGNLASFTDGNGHTATLGSYKRGIPQAIGYPDNTSESLVVDDLGQITSLTDQAGKTTSYAYDGVGRLTQITYPTGDSVAWAPKVFTYDYVTSAERGIAANHWRRTVSHGDARSVTYFDAELRPVLSDTYISTDGNSHITARTDYDWRGQKTFASYPQSGALNLSDLTTGTTTQYDALGRATQTQQTSELGTLTSSTAYLSGARVQVTDPKGKVTTTTYQVFDQPSYDSAILVQAPDGISQAIARDVYGNPLSIRQYGSYNGLTSDLTKYLYYDSYHRLCRTAEPESGSTVMAYDAANNVAWTADGLSISGTDCGQSSVADAAKTTRTYDAMSRVLTLAPPAGTQSTQYTYDARGNVQTAVSGMSTWSSARNGLGLLTSETLQITGQNAWTLGYDYDANGSPGSITYPDGSAVAYAPDALGRPTQVGSYATGVSYFPNGEVSAFTFGNGALYAANQNARKLLSDFSYALNVSSPDISEAYTCDANANITQVNDLTGGPRTKSFGYDDLNRLTSATATNLWGTESYTYDPLNNIASRTGGSTTVTYSYDATNRLTGLSDGTTFGYDNRGNVTSKNGVALTFDAKNQLQNVGGSVAYAYDASGRRVSKTPASGGATYYFYSQAGQLMYQWEPSSLKSTDYVYLGKRMLARNETYNTQVMGNIDGVNIDGSGNATITGWACSTHLDQSIGVEVFAGGASGAGGVRIATATANVASEPAVASACQAGGTNYRFNIPVTDTMRSQHGGQVIYMYGDSPVGNGNLALTRSGSFTVPVPAVSGAPTITSPVTGTSNSTGAYTVAWSGVTGATSYNLQQQLNGGSWSTIQSSSATSLAISGKGNGTYGYQVQACTSSGCSAWSTAVSTTVLLLPSAPASMSVPATSSGSIAVSWAASSTATSYTLQQRLNGSSWSTVYSGSATANTRSVSATGSYTFQVQACNASGCSGWAGSTAVAVTIPPASAPSLSVPSSSNSGSYTVSWTGVGGATSYTLQEQVNGGGWTTIQTGSATSKAISGKGNGTYGYHVQACNAGGCGPWSGAGTVAVTLPPATPTLSVSQNRGAGTFIIASLTWTAEPTATTYVLQENSGTTIQQMYSGSGTTWSGGYSGALRTFRVEACNSAGCSAWTGWQ